MDPYPHGLEREEGGCEASEVEENPRRGRHRVEGGVESSPDDSTRHRESGGIDFSQDDLTPNGEGGGVESWQDDSTPQTNGGGIKSSWDELTPKENGGRVKSSWDDSNPREDGGPRGDETLGSPVASQSRRGEDGRRRGGGDENPLTARNTRDRPTDGGDGTARRGATARQDAETETEERSGGAWYPSAHSAGAAEATNESDTRQRCEYGKEAAASVGAPGRLPVQSELSRLNR